MAIPYTQADIDSLAAKILHVDLSLSESERALLSASFAMLSQTISGQRSVDVLEEGSVVDFQGEVPDLEELHTQLRDAFSPSRASFRVRSIGITPPNANR